MEGSPTQSDGVSVVITKTVDPMEYEKHTPLEEIKPDHYFDDGRIPVFKPTMDEFRSFKEYIGRINHYGMKSGIVKVIPPKEWVDALPPLDDKVRSIRVKNPIEQQIFGGKNGEYLQTNIVRQRTYNLPQWRQLCEQSNHQPPARRGERRRGQTARGQSETAKQQRARRAAAKKKAEEEARPASEKADEGTATADSKTNPPTPCSPGKNSQTPDPSTQETPTKGRQTRKRTKRNADWEDETLWEGFDYRLDDADEFTDERCRELEKHYWKSLTYNNPLYGADMPGSLFDDRTTSWNVAKLENILDCLGKKIPGVNTAYLYMGMWKATFAWHLEDVDLYSINYIHFGAPKQWYSISQEDASKFEAVMKGIWPNEAKKCDQFLRHKTFSVSPSYLADRGIKVNRLVHRQQEFVITFPYGYHSGYNLGYNCAESVNFATEEWLEYAKKSKRCMCIDDAVWLDAYEIERRLRGEVTDEDEEMADAPLSPPDSTEGRPVKRRKKSGAGGKRGMAAKPKVPVRKPLESCVLCPNKPEHEEILDTDDGQKVHRICAMFTPETFFKQDEVTGKEIVCNVSGIGKARLSLKCTFCKQTTGSCFQCSFNKCVRAYHGTCAAAAGVLIQLKSSAIQENGKELSTLDPYCRCKYHRPKRPKDWKPSDGETDEELIAFASKAGYPETVQMQFEDGEMFAGVVLENRTTEHMLLVQTLPDGDTVEVPYKWVLSAEHSSEPGLWAYRPPRIERKIYEDMEEEDDEEEEEEEDEEALQPAADGAPRKNSRFLPKSKYRWCEFELFAVPPNEEQVSVDVEKAMNYYLPLQSTMTTARYASIPNGTTANKATAPQRKPAKPRKPKAGTDTKAKAVKQSGPATPSVGNTAPTQPVNIAPAIPGPPAIPSAHAHAHTSAPAPAAATVTGTGPKTDPLPMPASQQWPQQQPQHSQHTQHAHHPHSYHPPQYHSEQRQSHHQPQELPPRPSHFQEERRYEQNAEPASEGASSRLNPIEPRWQHGYDGHRYAQTSRPENPPTLPPLSSLTHGEYYPQHSQRPQHPQHPQHPQNTHHTQHPQLPPHPQHPPHSHQPQPHQSSYQHPSQQTQQHHYPPAQSWSAPPRSTYENGQPPAPGGRSSYPPQSSYSTPAQPMHKPSHYSQQPYPHPPQSSDHNPHYSSPTPYSQSSYPSQTSYPPQSSYQPRPPSNTYSLPGVLGSILPPPRPLSESQLSALATASQWVSQQEERQNQQSYRTPIQ